MINNLLLHWHNFGLLVTRTIHRLCSPRSNIISLVTFLMNRLHRKGNLQEKRPPGNTGGTTTFQRKTPSEIKPMRSFFWCMWRFHQFLEILVVNEVRTSHKELMIIVTKVTEEAFGVTLSPFLLLRELKPAKLLFVAWKLICPLRAMVTKCCQFVSGFQH